MEDELPQSDTHNWNDIFSECFIGKVITDLFIFLEQTYPVGCNSIRNKIFIQPF